MSSRVLVDTNVLVDLLTDDPEWGDWSDDAFCACSDHARLVIDTPVYAELAVRYESVEALEQMIDAADLEREHVPWSAAFLAGKAFMDYRKAGGTRRSPLPDFYIGAHAAVTGMSLLTRDAARYRTYFPTVELIAPDDGRPRPAAPREASATVFAAMRRFTKKNCPQARLGARDEAHKAAATRSAMAAGR